MMRSIFAGVSGSRNHQARLDVIGNNIANVNTIGYKSSRMTFQEAFAQTIRSGSSPISGKTGGRNPAQVGLGNLIRSIDVDMTQGGLEGTDKPTDLAIDGDGFFVVSDGVATKYTRDGSFNLDGEGYLVCPGSGYKVLGWMATNGKIDKSQPLEPIRLQLGESMTAQATDLVRYRGNLDAESSDFYTLESLGIAVEVAEVLNQVAANAASVSGADAQAVVNAVTDARGDIDADMQELITAANGAFTDPSAPPDSVITAIRDRIADTSAPLAYPGVAEAVADACEKVADSVPGATAQDIVQFLAKIQTTVADVGQAAVSAANSVDSSASPDKVEDAVAGVLDSVNVSLAAAQATPSEWSTQTEVYDSQGVKHELHLVFTKIENNRWAWKAVSDGATGEGIIRFRTDGSCDRDSMLQRVTIDPRNGAEIINITVDFSSVSQFGADSSVTDAVVNGFPSGTLESFKIDPDGTVTGIYSNQQNEVLGQIVLAKFTNPAGLSRDGNNLYSQTPNSGTPNIGAPGDSGRGSIMSNMVEMSNVDLAREFTDLIITLRGFQANARLITTAEEMLQELIQLKR